MENDDFRFKLFQNQVTNLWNEHGTATDPPGLHMKFLALSKALTFWNRGIVSIFNTQRAGKFQRGN